MLGDIVLGIVAMFEYFVIVSVEVCREFFIVKF